MALRLSEGLGVTALTNAGAPYPRNWAPVTFERGVDGLHVDWVRSRILRPNPVPAVVRIWLVHHADDSMIVKGYAILIAVLTLYAGDAIH